MSSNALMVGGQDLTVTINILRSELRTAMDTADKLRLEIESIKTELATERTRNTRSVSRLRHQLSPLYQALREVFGEIESISGAEVQDATVNMKWEFWKKRYPGRIAETIDLLLVQGQMNSKQLCHALRCDPRTLAKSVIYQLNSAGLLVKNGGMFSLKEI